MIEPILTREEKDRLIIILNNNKSILLNCEYYEDMKQFVFIDNKLDCIIKQIYGICKFNFSLNPTNNCLTCWFNWFVNDTQEFLQVTDEDLVLADLCFFETEKYKKDRFLCYPLYWDALKNEDIEIIKDCLNNAITYLSA